MFIIIRKSRNAAWIQPDDSNRNVLVSSNQIASIEREVKSEEETVKTAITYDDVDNIAQDTVANETQTWCLTD